jgi:DNA topoisomerase-1
MRQERWIVREGSKTRGFRYRGPTGRLLRDRGTLARIDALRIPPAWRDVHIAPGVRAAVQAWGLDAKGRKQYRYHSRAVERGAQRKYHRVRRLARRLPRIRDALRRDLRRPSHTREHVTAAATLLISKGFFRVGGERYARENGTFGLATLRKRHVERSGDALRFTYTGKRGKQQCHVVVDRELSRSIARLLRTPGARLFRYRDADGWRDLTAREINAYLRTITKLRFVAKDFRTWGGTLRLATVLADLGPAASEREATKNVTMAVRLVAAELGNAPAICRGSYVHPIVIARYLDAGETIALPRRGASDRRVRGGYYPEERALLDLLDRYFPERRRRVRPEERVAA